MKRYNNYHKHDHISNIFTPDTNAHFIDYVKRAIELGEPNVWTTNHGSGGDIFEAKQLADEYGLNVKFGLEGYIVPNPLEKDNRNYHIILIPKTNKARKKLNLANSRANIEGYYYKPRLFLEDLLNFDKDELYITTACVAGLLKDEDSYNQLFIPLFNRFGDNLFLEVQNHNEEIQKEVNRKALKLKEQFGLKLIAANDSHYIYPEQSNERLELLKGKGINYGEEDNFVLDYPDYDTMYNRFVVQGILSEDEIAEAINNTLIFDDVENIEIDKSIKMPTIYKGKTDEEKYHILVNEMNKRFSNVMDVDNIPLEDRQKYINECKKELQVIYETKDEIHTPDYFLLNIEVINKAVNEYGGTLTRTGRGSCGSFLVNKILGITQIDRLTVDLPMYSDRFMSTARLLENKALPDVDFNVSSQEPFVKATKDLLGENGCYPMVAYGTMKLGEAFRNTCRSHGMQFDEYNEVAKSIENYTDNPQWKEVIEEANKYVGTIISASVHPCAHLLLNEDIREEVGVIRLGEFICAMITSNEADAWKYLKNDYLIVTVWDIIDKVFKMINKPIMTIKELLESVDDKVWKLFDYGITCTLNQVEGTWATDLLMKFKPRTIEEMAMFVAAIRPSFESLRDDFIARSKYTTGSKYLDELFNNTYHRCCFQENIMKYFEWLGVSPAESIGLIKKISKKKIHKEDFEALEERIREQWKVNTGSYDEFDESWADMQSNMKYSFNSPHGLATALDCLYCAYLKANHPLEYYTVVFNLYSDDKAKSDRLNTECKYFGISVQKPMFRHSDSNYSNNGDKIIYKGIGSIKNIGSACGDNLNTLKDNHYDTFIDLLYDISEGGLANKTELTLLIMIDFFREFGDINYLLACYEVFMKLGKRCSLTLKDLDKYNLTREQIEPFCEKATEKQFRGVNMKEVIKLICSNLTYEPITDAVRMVYDVAILGYSDITIDCDEKFYIVSNKETNKYGTTFITIYRMCDGKYFQYKVKRWVYNENPCDVGDAIMAIVREQNRVTKNENDEWIKTDVKEVVIKDYALVRKYEIPLKDIK